MASWRGDCQHAARPGLAGHDIAVATRWRGRAKIRVPPATATAHHTGVDMDIGQITRQLLGIARS